MHYFANEVEKTLNKNISELLASENEFSMFLAASPCILSESERKKAEEKYSRIIEFFAVTNSLMNKALFSGDQDLYDLFFQGRSDKGRRVEEHKVLYRSDPNPTPLFFRTDEAGGKIVEIQCPGSGFAQLGELQKAWQAHDHTCTWEDWSQQVAIILRNRLDGQRIAYLEKSTNPQDTALFIAALSKADFTIVKADSTAALSPCSLLRDHNYHTLRKEKYFGTVLKQMANKELIIDVPPTLIYSMKLCLALPFEKATRKYYTEQLRSLFPETHIIKPDATIKLNDKNMDYNSYCDLPDKQRRHIIKLADGRGRQTDGGKSVFSLSRVRKSKCRALINQALLDHDRHRPWIIQEEVGDKLDYEYLCNGEIKKENGYAKFSGFYGPEGLLSAQVQYKNFYKVSGSNTTSIAPIVFRQTKKSP